MQAVLLDIEGTTTPIAFVYDVLFPYARARLREYLQNPVNREALVEPLKRLSEEYAEDCSLDLPSRSHEVTKINVDDEPSWHRDFVMKDDAIAEYVEWLMDRDRKSPGLKLLQGQIWERGYRSGKLRGEVFDDVPRALQRWHDARIPVAIYSSGSELAQRLLFGSTMSGDLTSLIARFFDTTVGPKTSSDSYRRIATELDCPTTDMWFVSDVTTELDAASGAQCQTRLCVRPGNRPQPHHAHHVIHSLDDVGG